MLSYNNFFVYPRHSYCTNFGDSGIHLDGVDHFQMPLIFSIIEHRFQKFDQSLAIYDSYCELLPECLIRLNNNLANFQFEVDLYGCKPIDQIDSPYILSSKKSKDYIFSYGRELIPHEANVIAEIPSIDIGLAKKSAFENRILGFSNERKVYFHRLPPWHLNLKIDQIKGSVPLNEDEEVLLKINTLPVFRSIFRLIIIFFNKMRRLKNRKRSNI